MINTEMKLTGDFTAQLGQFEKDVQEQVVISGVAAMAKVIYDETRLNASKHIKTGTLYDAIYRTYSKEKSTGAVKTYRISWNKKTAPHGHLLEFGTSRAPAYPFLRPAFSRIHEAIDAGKVRMGEKFDEIKGAS